MISRCYVAVYSDGSFAGVDVNSGGYPYKITGQYSLNEVHFWNDKVQAENYCDSFHDGLEVKEFHWEVK